MNIDDFASTPWAGEIQEGIGGYLGLLPLAEILATADVEGAMRLLSCPAFEPIEALTLRFRDGQVRVSPVVSDGDAWNGSLVARMSRTTHNSSVVNARSRPPSFPLA